MNTVAQAIISGFSTPKAERIGQSFASNGHTGSGGKTLFKVKAELAPSEVACISAKQSLESLGLELSAVDCVISASQTPDFNNPGLVSCLIARLGLTGVPAIEIRQLSNGALQALEAASALVESGQSRCVLVTCVDLLSRYFGGVQALASLDEDSRAAAATLADGCASFLVLNEEVYRAAKNKPAAFRLKASSIVTKAADSESFYCPLPAAGKFPLRLSVDDIAAGKHLPRFSAHRYLSSLDALFLSALNPKPDWLYHGPINSSDLPGSLSKLENSIFRELGFVGSAGIILELLAQLEKSQQRKKLCTLFTLSAGPSYALATLEAL